jgi:hypothetical protein
MLRLVAILLAASGVEAQRVESSVDVSGTNVWYADSIRSGGASVNPSLRLDWGHATVPGSASFSRLAPPAQGVVSLSIFRRASVPSPSSGLVHSEAARTPTDTNRSGLAWRELTRRYARRVTIGGGGGRTWDGVIWRDVRQGDAGAWLEHSGMTALATIAPVVVQDTIRYTDVQAAWRFPVGSYEFGATAGVRGGAAGAAVGGSSRAWASVSVVAWFTRGLALVASGGSYPVDFTQGYPGGHFVSVAVRIASREGRPRRDRADSTRVNSATTVSFRRALHSRFGTTPAASCASTHRRRECVASTRTSLVGATYTQARGGDGGHGQADRAGLVSVNLRIDGGE